MSKIDIDFNSLKYNLYDILNIPHDADDTKIKKSFLKLIKNFHPDKNSDLEEDIYYHIVTANQILSNKESRQKYDNYITQTAKTFHELKVGFDKTTKDNFPKKEDSQKIFNNKKEELDRKHGIDNFNKKSVMEQFNKMKDTRRDLINKTMEQTNDDKCEIIDITNAPFDITSFSTTELTSIEHLDKLYLEDSVQDKYFTSLNIAFKRPEILVSTIDYKQPLDEKIKSYNNLTEVYQNNKDFKVV